MAQATPSTPGEVILAGDLAGNDDAFFPELRATGVTPGLYPFVHNLAVDTKGRLVFVTSATPAVLGEAVTKASTTEKGAFRIGSGLTISNGVVTVGAWTLNATWATLGFVSVGANFAITDNVLSVAPSTSSTRGLIQIGDSFVMAGNTLNPVVATTTSPGIFSLNSTTFTGTSNMSLAVSRVDFTSVFTKAQGGAVQSYTINGTFTPNMQTGPNVVSLTLSGDLTIAAPTVLAPSNSVVQMQVVITNPSNSGYTVTLAGYKTNRTLYFSQPINRDTCDVLTLICTSTECFCILNTDFTI